MHEHFFNENLYKYMIYDGEFIKKLIRMNIVITVVYWKTA